MDRPSLERRCCRLSRYFRIGDKDISFRFYRLPKVLFEDKRYSSLSADAKLLYGLLIDRMELSITNVWADGEGRVFVYFSVREAAGLLGFGHDKVSRLFAKLERAGLIERRKQGLCKPDVIYPMKFHTTEAALRTSENQTSGTPEISVPDTAKSDTNDTEMNDTDVSDTHLSFREVGAEGLETEIRELIEYDTLIGRYSGERLDELVNIITQIMCLRSSCVSIGGQEYPAEYVRHRFSKIRAQHIECVLDRMDANTVKVKNISAYLTAALFNATATTENYWLAEVNHDMAAGQMD